MRLKFVVPGYENVQARHAAGLALAESRYRIEEALASGTLYEFAQRHPEARRLSGRAPVYALPLGDVGNIVVRHSMRGGVLAKTGTDLFFPPTRALRELVNSLRLRASGVPTPQVVAYATYPAGGILRRADVVTREIENSADLATFLAARPEHAVRTSVVEATARLLAGLTRAGAHHPDLNAKNILVTMDDTGATVAHVIDVDRVRFHVPGDPMLTDANVERLARSMRKWRERGLSLLSDDEQRAVATRTFELA